MSPLRQRSLRQSATCCEGTALRRFRIIGPGIHWREQPTWPLQIMTKTNMTLTSLTPKQRTQILASVKQGILKHHFNVGGVDYHEWARRFDERSASLLGVDIEEFEGGVRRALAELG